MKKIARADVKMKMMRNREETEEEKFEEEETKPLRADKMRNIILMQNKHGRISVNEPTVSKFQSNPRRSAVTNIKGGNKSKALRYHIVETDILKQVLLCS